MDKKKILEEIFNDDPLGLLHVKPTTSSVRNADERLLASFQEINDFFEKHHKQPDPNPGNIAEYQLYARLKSLRESEEKMQALEPEDKYGLLKTDKKEISSIDDILGDDKLDILGNDEAGLFDFKHIPKETTMPEYVAKRKKCEEFSAYEQKFKDCQSDLASSKRKLYPFKNEQQIDKGYFFVLKGILLYVAEIGEKEPDDNGKINARLRCIFENGTESDMLLRSLAAELYKDGRRVTEHEDKLLDNLYDIKDEDQESGFIYVLRSKSEKTAIKDIPHLYKIGYSKTDIQERIKNAEKEPTYLMAPVEYLAGWKCYNMNTQKFEQLIHNFFGKSCLAIDVFDENGKRYTPREWFIAPIEVIEQAIELIINGKIIDYKYDADSMAIIKR